MNESLEIPPIAEMAPIPDEVVQAARVINRWANDYRARGMREVRVIGSKMADTVSRGYWGIREITERMQSLVDWTKKFKPEQRCLTLARKDYDLIKRWPKAGHSLGIDYTQTEIWWQGLELVYDSSLSRYAKVMKPTQADLCDVPPTDLETKLKESLR